jgi:hypothetical protein
MRVVHRLVGYDRRTDRATVRFDVPGKLLPAAFRIAQVPGDDPDAVWSYPLCSDQARELADLIGAKLDADGAEFFLEAFADPAPNGTVAAP